MLLRIGQALVWPDALGNFADGQHDTATQDPSLCSWFLCPRLKELSNLHLFLPRDSEIAANLKRICHATIDPAKAAKQWDPMVHLFASVHSGHSSAINVLARYGSAARSRGRCSRRNASK